MHARSTKRSVTGHIIATMKAEQTPPRTRMAWAGNGAAGQGGEGNGRRRPATVAMRRASCRLCRRSLMDVYITAAPARASSIWICC